MILHGQEFIDYNQAQVCEILKFKWVLGVKLHHDPLIDYTLNDIAEMWVNLYAAEFRVYWEKEHHWQYIKEIPSGINS